MRILYAKRVNFYLSRFCSSDCIYIYHLSLKQTISESVYSFSSTETRSTCNSVTTLLFPDFQFLDSHKAIGRRKGSPTALLLLAQYTCTCETSLRLFLGDCCSLTSTSFTFFYWSSTFPSPLFVLSVSRGRETTLQIPVLFTSISACP